MAPFTVDDGFRLAAVEDPQVSPDGRAALYVVNTPDLAGNGSVSTIHLVKLDDNVENASGGATAEGPTTRQLTLGPGDGAPRWSPDGHTISFTRRGTIYTMDLNGGEPVQLSPIRLGDAMWALNNYAWSPDGKWIALVSRGKDGRAYQPTISMGSAEDDMFVADRIFYKWNKGYNPGMQRDGSYTATHIFVVSTSGSGDAGEPIQLTYGEQDDHSLTWSPDSSEIAFVSNRTGDWSNNGNNDLFATDLRGTVRRITSCEEFCFTPCWSPNGVHIAFSIQRPSSKDSPAADHHVGVVPASGGVAVDLTVGLDRRVQYGSAVPLQWTDDSSAVLFPAADHGMRHVYAIGLTPGSVAEQLTAGRRQITHFSAGGSTLLCTMKDEHAPAELMRFKIASADSSGIPSALEVGAITAVNAEVLAEVETATAEQFTFTTWDGQTLEGWFMRPIGWVKGKRYPAVLNVHGGPHGMHGYVYNPMFQSLAGAGYAVILLNPRGSNGYGQTFSDGCVGDWGGGDYRDLMSGLDCALAENDWIDPERLGVCGGSYGGYMTMWIVTQTGRFKAAVAHAGLSNHISFYGTSMYQLLCEFEFEGKPWEKHDLYWDRSPLAHITAATTPMLLTHGEQDMDVPIPQSEEYFVALRKLGVPCVFVRYPREGHGLSEPQHVRDYLLRHLSWFNQHIKGEQSAFTARL